MKGIINPSISAMTSDDLIKSQVAWGDDKIDASTCHFLVSLQQARHY
jgi:hypothetical protein